MRAFILGALAAVVGGYVGHIVLVVCFALSDKFDDWRVARRVKRGLPPYKVMEYNEGTARRYGIPRRKRWEERVSGLLQTKLW